MKSERVQLHLFGDPERIVEQRRIRLGGQEVVYRLKRSAKRQRMLLTVDESGLTVSVPWRTAEHRIDALLHESMQWVLRKLEVYAARRRPVRVWAQGAQVEFLGRSVQLDLRRHNGRTITQLRDGDVLEVWLGDTQHTDQVREAVINWYRRHAAPHFRARVAHYCGLLGEALPRVMLTSAKGRWGSCNAGREVRLNWRLMQAPPHVVDYVVAHEVSHLRVMNHSGRFWRLVEQLHPDYRAARAQLDSAAGHYLGL